ncbi:hypothetical protein [Kineococcus sp. SYSU DK005]|uniref:hypothetical protein n=1 Tax=Kineococcus sp. SYSU DK005 TaxID=3383126 RepID=UPI003D7DFE13
MAGPGAVREPRGDEHGDGDRHEHDDGLERDDGGSGAGPAVWALLVAAVAPVLLAAQACRRFLAGARDDDVQELRWRARVSSPEGFEGGLSPLGATDRWGPMLEAVPAATALLASTVGLLAVAGLALAGRPAWLAPTAAQRRAGAGVAAVLVLASLALAGGSLATVSAEDDGGLSPWGSSWSWLEACVPLGTALLCATLAVLCAGVLLRPGPRPGGSADGSAVASAGTSAGGAAEGAAGEPGPRAGASPVSAPPVPAVTSAPPAPQAPPAAAPPPPAAAAPPAPQSGAAPRSGAEGLPRVPQDDLALYRRPS